jgi:dipeptidase E
MKLFLTSSGFSESNKAEFIRLLGRDPLGLKVAFIPTASSQDTDLESRNFYLTQAQKSIIDLGMTYEIVNLEKQNPNFIVDLFKPYDIIFVDGGNTFYLMNEMNISGFKKNVHEILKDKVYVGVSAGSVVVGPDITLAGWDPGDENNIGLVNMGGLGLIDFCIMPHWDGTIYEEAKNYNYRVEYIKDCNAISNDSAV